MSYAEALEPVDVNLFTGRFKGDNAIVAKFYAITEPDETGVYVPVDFVEIRIVGKQNDIVRRAARKSDKVRFKAQYEAYLAGKESVLTGTPLNAVEWFPRERIEELNYLGVSTLENLSSIDDTACMRIPGLFEIRARAKREIDKAEAEAPLQELRAENDDLKRRLSELEGLMKTKAKAG